MKIFEKLFLTCLILAIAGCQQKESAPVQAPVSVAPVVQQETKVSEWPKDGRYAVCSDDGKTVAVTSGTDIVVMRDGKEISRIDIRMKSPNAILNKDGSRLAAYSLKRKQVILWDVERNQELLAIKGSDYEFSPGGSNLAVRTSKGVEIFSSWGGYREQIVPDEEGDKKIRDFQFANVGNDDGDVTINVVHDKGYVTQWEPRPYESGWHMRKLVRHWASEDQDYDPWIRN